MSSGKNGGKTGLGPGPGTPAPGSNARVASTWGAARDALAAVRNLESLLRSATIPRRTLTDLIPELRPSVSVLGDGFEGALAADPATAAVGSYGQTRVAELASVLDEVAAASETRVDLASRIAGLADELEASIDLLALLDRAAAPAVTEVTLDLVAREVDRMSGSARGRAVRLRFDEAKPDCVVLTDPYVLGLLLSLVIASLQNASAEPLVLRARSAPQATFLVEPASRADASLPLLTIRVMQWVAPSEQAGGEVAARLGASLDIRPTRGTIVLRP